MLEPFLLELALLFALCVGTAVLFHRFRLPPIVGFLVVGAVVGPFSIGLVQQQATVQTLSEVGVVVLLFALGMEVPLGQLARLRRTILIGGGLQVCGTVALAAGATWALGLPWHQAVFVGFLLALSSTAASTKVLIDHGDFSTPHGRVVLGIDIAQDLAVVPMILLMPLLALGAGRGIGAGTEGAEPATLGSALLHLLLLVVVMAIARLIVPRVLDLVSRTRSRELFVLTLATLCLSLAVVTAHLGLSLALGAFLAGILLADSDHHGQAAAEVEPFRDALASLFFVSIGMLFDWRAIVDEPVIVTSALLAVLVGKAGVVFLVARALGQPFWTRLRAALALAQVGEFSFVLAQIGTRNQVMPDGSKRVFVVVAVLSIAATPLLYALGRTFAARAKGASDTGRPGEGKLQDHAIVVGYGPTGRTVVQALQVLGLPVVATELNAATVKAEKARGIPIVLGDATRIPVLRSLGIERARTLVLAVNDAAAAARIAQITRQIAPHVHVLARAVYIAEADGLRRAGAHDVVPQELEASVEIMVRVLRRFLIADDEIGRLVDSVRAHAGGGARAAAVARTGAMRIAEFVPGIGFAIWRIAAGSPAAGHSLAQVGVRRHTGCSVVAVRRDGTNLPIVTPETMLQPGDTVVVIGPEARLPDVAAMFQAPADMPATAIQAAVAAPPSPPNAP